MNVGLNAVILLILLFFMSFIVVIIIVLVIFVIYIFTVFNQYINNTKKDELEKDLGKKLKNESKIIIYSILMFATIMLALI